MRVGFVELLAHAEALGALAGEEVGELAVLGAGAVDVWRGVSVGEGLERGEQLLAVCAQGHRAVLEGRAGDEEGVGDVGRVELWVLLRCAASRFAASANAGSALAERASGIAPASPCLEEAPEPFPVSSRAPTGTGSGASSKITWALVPLMPNEETPARRGRPLPSQAAGSVSSSISPASQSTLEEGASTCRVFGRTPSRIASAILITPATPAAAWVWPMLDLIEPSRSGSSLFLAVGGEQCSRLDRVAEGGAGAVGLDRVDVLWLQAGVGERLADHPLLGGPVGGGEAVGGAVLVDRRAA